ncbi:hypothetical protein [Lichenifustis flavocetrariae]|uniref:Uncharacterized protein n=1 Tax=Lichenifustis flavocetrariae TaxID=2949735 RepID=A0AA42CRF5_9HYPH|nr:hypothetical protein [Lichenifustis flavocetrariae]MCW6512425.1 hypothetical protein [Lichenifustis flavocetrariae]
MRVCLSMGMRLSFGMRADWSVDFWQASDEAELFPGDITGKGVSMDGRLSSDEGEALIRLKLASSVTMVKTRIALLPPGVKAR